MCNNPCNTCGSCYPCSCDTGCLDIVNTSCINYDGNALSSISAAQNTGMNGVMSSLDTSLQLLQSTVGKVKTDPSDTVPATLIDKLQAGANILITNIGTGTAKKLKIDAVLGGQIVDEKLKVSATDNLSGYLESKIIGGDCIIIQKINAGLNESLKVSVDWNCVLNKLASLPGFCTIVSACTGGVTKPCPSISLNSPIISGSNVTVNWASTATQFVVFVDGVQEPGMPISSSSYSKTGLADGTHFIQVNALCTSGSPAQGTTSFVINTTCPSSSNLVASISGGNASLTWNPAVGVNVTGQVVKYRPKGGGIWTSSSVLGVLANSYNSITGLSANVSYDFEISTNCSVGGPTDSPITSQIEITCPTLTLTPSNTSIQYQFPNQGGNINSYTLDLMDSTGSTVLQSKVENVPFASIVTNSFTGLTQGTAYQVRATVYAENSAFNKVCSVQAISTTVPPVCPPPTGMSVSVS